MKNNFFLLIRVLCVMTTERFSFWQLCSVLFHGILHFTQRRGLLVMHCVIIYSHLLCTCISSPYSSHVEPFESLSVFQAKHGEWIVSIFFPEKKIKGRILIYFTHLFRNTVATRFLAETILYWYLCKEVFTMSSLLYMELFLKN